MSFTELQVLTFDCYGTLIDWETGVIDAFRPILKSYNINLTDDEILTAFAEIESPLQQAENKKYREILAKVCDEFGRKYNFIPNVDQRRSIAESIANWPVFPETIEALNQLKTKFKLGILSNIDDDLFAHSQKHLKLEFDWIMTSEQIGSYKPTRKNFEYMLDNLGVPREQILHVAQSKFHDIAPASELGLKTVWVNRRKGKNGFGATPASQAKPDYEIATLAELVDLLSTA